MLLMQRFKDTMKEKWPENQISTNILFFYLYIQFLFKQNTKQPINKYCFFYKFNFLFNFFAPLLITTAVTFTFSSVTGGVGVCAIGSSLSSSSPYAIVRSTFVGNFLSMKAFRNFVLDGVVTVRTLDVVELRKKCYTYSFN